MKRVYNLTRRPKERHPVIVKISRVSDGNTPCLKYKPCKLGSHVEPQFPPFYFTHCFSNIHVPILNINQASPDISMHISPLPAAAVQCKVPEKILLQGLMFSSLELTSFYVEVTFVLFLEVDSAYNLNLVVALKIILQLVQFKSNFSFYNQNMSESSLHTMQPPKLINLRISYAPRELLAAPELVATLAHGTIVKDGPGDGDSDDDDSSSAMNRKDTVNKLKSENNIYLL